MKEQTILHTFNVEGKFPTDEELRVIAIERGTEGTMWDMYSVEMELLFIAMNDRNHPYHYMVSLPK